MYENLDATFKLRIGVAGHSEKRLAVTSAQAAFEVTKEYAKADREMMLLVMVDSKNYLLSIETHSIGTVDSSAVYPREIFRSLLLKNASSFIMVHNHPSGDPTPSLMDKELTRDVAAGARLIGIKLLDHVILGDGKFYSMADHGEII